jgi:hypothetical protein
MIFSYLSDGHLIISPEVVKMEYHKNGGQKNCNTINQIINYKFRDPRMGRYPIHV